MSSKSAKTIGISESLQKVVPEHTRPPVANLMGPAELLPGLQELWQDTLGHPTIRVAVLDGAVDERHPCFAGHRIRRNLLNGRLQKPTLGFLSTQVRSKVASHHGTHVASLIFAQGACGIRGIAPRCSGMVLPIFEQTVAGSIIPCSQVDLARAIGQAVSAGAHIINISGGQLSSSGEASEFLRKAVQQAVDANILMISAVGNEGCECLHVPASLPGVLAVGALDDQGRPLDSSNWAKPLARQGIMAPGYRLPGAMPGGGISRMTGSSFATPLVSGVAALLLSLQLAKGQRPDPRTVRKALLQGASPCDAQQGFDCRRLLAGRLDIPAARALLGLDSDTRYQTLVGVSPGDHASHVESSPGSGVLPASESSGGNSATPLFYPAAGQIDSSRLTTRIFSCEEGADLVFALGEIGYDFGCEARLDYFVQQMGSLSSAMSPMCMAKYLQKRERVDLLKKKKGTKAPDPCPDVVDDPEGHEEDANALIWTLNIDSTPTFAILPNDQFAAKSYDLLTDFLFDQFFDPEDEKAKPNRRGGKSAAKQDADNKDAKSQERLYRVAVAGHIDGTTSLYNGTIVPVIRPVTRGMFNWDADTLLEAILGARPWADDQLEESVAIQDFLRRIYYELRNLGQTSQERALNFAGTNAYNSGEVFREAWGQGLKGLEHFGVEPSPICRPDSDCWDVKMTFFDPDNPYQRARWVYRYTIDVSDVIPVTVGPVRAWPVYTNPKN